MQYTTDLDESGLTWHNFNNFYHHYERGKPHLIYLIEYFNYLHKQSVVLAVETFHMEPLFWAAQPYRIANYGRIHILRNIYNDY